MIHTQGATVKSSLRMCQFHWVLNDKEILLSEGDWSSLPSRGPACAKAHGQERAWRDGKASWDWGSEIKESMRWGWRGRWGQTVVKNVVPLEWQIGSYWRLLSREGYEHICIFKIQFGLPSGEVMKGLQDRWAEASWRWLYWSRSTIMVAG